MNFKQLDNEHVAQAWGRMKSLVKNCPTHCLSTWMVIQTFYAGLNFTSRNLLDSTAGGTFMSTTLGAATKLLDEMMTNYSQWHNERAPTGRKVNSIEEISSLRDATTSGLAAIWFIKVAYVWDILETWVSVIVSLVWRLEISIFMFSNRLLMSCKIAVCSFNCLETVLFCSYWVCI